MTGKKSILKKLWHPLLGWFLIALIVGVGLSLFFKAKGSHNPWADGFQPANFIVLCALVYYLAKERFKRYFQTRHQEIAEQIEQSEKRLKEIEEEYAEYQKRLSQLEKEISQIRERIRKEGEFEREQILKEAKRQIERIKNEAEFTAQQEIKSAQARLYQSAVKKALELAEQFIRSQIKPEDEKRLFEEYIKEVESGKLG